MRNIALITVLVLLTSCGKSMEGQVNDIVKAKDLWLESSQGKDYKYNLSIHWIGSKAPATYYIQVISGVPSKALPQDISTIKGLFNYTFESIKDEKLNVKAIYDSKLGYPLSIKASNPKLIDGSSTITVANFEFM